MMSSVDRKNQKLLVVDDDASFLDLLRQFFKLKGWDVVTAEDAEQGIRQFRRHHPAAVILDLCLGDGRDGISLCDQIRDDISSEGTAILILSAESRTAQEQIKARAAGADAYLMKPIQMKELEARLNEALRARVPQNRA
jgi:DNA-binding response OmpR family regulator